MIDSAENRRVMVDSQVRPSDVTKYPIIEAMLAVPREAFVPNQSRAVAYMDDNIGFATGRTVLAPRTLAKMLDALDIRADEAVLDLGCGFGYSTAIAARLAEVVVGVEEEPSIASEAQAVLLEHGFDNAAVVEGPLNEGAAKAGPYDVILIQGAIQVLPDAIADQLKVGGRMCALFAEGPLGQARMGIKTTAGLSWRWLFDAGAPVLPGFAQERAFEL